MADFEPDSEPWRMAQLDAELAKGRYQQAVDDAHREHLPEPPPFDEAAADVDLALEVEGVLRDLEEPSEQ
jgi:hypothetical protein